MKRKGLIQTEAPNKDVPNLHLASKEELLAELEKREEAERENKKRKKKRSSITHCRGCGSATCLHKKRVSKAIRIAKNAVLRCTFAQLGGARNRVETFLQEYKNIIVCGL